MKLHAFVVVQAPQTPFTQLAIREKGAFALS